MLVHRKSAHAFIDPIVLRIDDSSVCAGCHCQFHSRIRVTRHVMDRRNSKCREQVLRLPPLPQDVLNKLVEIDRAERKSARQKGHSHPTARVQARTASGKAIGHVQH